MSNSDLVIKKVELNCSFCGKSRDEVEQMIEGPDINGYNLYICNECVDMSYEILHTPEQAKPPVNKEKPQYTPEELKVHLDKHIIGQDAAKKAVSVAFYNHIKRINNKSNIEIDKSNLLLIGSTGCGKTLVIKTMAKLLNMPYIIADATSITEAGYVGEDVENLLRRLLLSAKGDVEKAQKGIIFIDEIDKKSRKAETSTVGRDISGEGVQQALLKMIEGAVFEVETDDAIVQFDTKDVLFIFSGAFAGLDEIVKKSSVTSTIGLNATLTTKQPFAKSIDSVSLGDFIKFGMIPEFIGRCPVVVIFDDLTEEIMLRILKEPEHSIVNQFKELFRFDGVTLDFEDKYLSNVVTKCMAQQTGARGLRAILEKDLSDVQFILPTLVKDRVKKVVITENGTYRYTHKVKKQVNDG